MQDNEREVTDDEAGEVAEGEEAEIGDETEIGKTVTKGGADDPKKKLDKNSSYAHSPQNRRTRKHKI